MDANHFVEFVKANMENPKISDAEFRKIICDSIDLVTTEGTTQHKERLQRYEEWLERLEAVPHFPE